MNEPPEAEPEVILSAAPRRAAVTFVLITVALDMLTIGIIAPVLPKLVLQFLFGDAARTAQIYGLFGTVWALMQFVCSPVLGSLSDRFGRRPVILLSNLGLGLDYILMAMAPTLSWLFVGRVISGITAASVPTASAYIADVTPPEKRAGAFGLIGAAFGFGFVVGPAIGGLLGSVNPRLPFWAAAGFSLLNAAYGFFVLPESLARDRRSSFSWRRANPVGALKLLRSHHELFGLATVNFLGYIAHESLPSMFVLYAGYRYGWGERAVGLALAVVGICSAVVSAVLTRPLVARFGERRIMLAGFFCGILGFAVFGIAKSGWIFFFGIPLIALWGLAGPTSQGLMSRHVGAGEQGQLQGANSSLRGISGMIGPAVFTLTFASFIGLRGSFQLPGAPYFLAAVLLIIALMVAWRVTRRSLVLSSAANSAESSDTATPPFTGVT
jgi:MFS transporter, DHA1 family, tetracycline resistance protein